MPGFLGAFAAAEYTDTIFPDQSTNELVNKHFCLDHPFKVQLYQNTLNKFLQDKVFFRKGELFFAIEGVVFNTKELQKKYCVESWEDVVKKMYYQEGDDFFKDFRGSFSGIVIDLTNRKVIIFTDHIGEKQIYYSTRGNRFFFGSTFFDVCSLLKSNDLALTLDVCSAYILLTYGYMITDGTLFNEIKRLDPGSYIKIDFSAVQPKITSNIYYSLDNTPINNKKDEVIIDELDVLFRQAVKRSFDKDDEYGYKHLVSLSGGLDSRMTTLVAKDLGYENIVNLTFAQSTSLDAKIACQIASYLGTEWIYKTLDDGLGLKYIDETTKILGGNSIYSGTVHAKSFLDILNVSNFGMYHTGQLGDAIVGYCMNKPDYSPKYSTSVGLYSKFLIQKINKDIIKRSPNQELFFLNTRGFRGANNALQIQQEKLETFSPFYDVDFMDYALSIPINKRLHHVLYYKWINNKYPKAADFVYAKYGSKINEINFVFMGRRIYLKQIPNLSCLVVKKAFGMSALASKTNMNPMDYWLKNRPIVKKYLDDYFSDNVEVLADYPEVYNDCIKMYQLGSAIEKTLTLTLVSSLKIAYDGL